MALQLDESYIPASHERLIPDEPVGKPTSEEKIPDESISRVEQLAIIFSKRIKNTPEFRQALLNESVQVLTSNNSGSLSSEKKDLYAKKLFIVVEPYFGSNWEDCQIGIRAEVCVRMALKEIGFDLFEPTKNDDLHGAIDVFADPKEVNGPIYAIQIKSHYNLEFPVVESLPNSQHEKGDIEISSYLTPEQYEDSVRTASRMRNRIHSENLINEHPEFADRRIFPLIIRIPGGNIKRDIISPFKRTGEPILGFSESLYDKIETALGWDKESY